MNDRLPMIAAALATDCLVFRWSLSRKPALIPGNLPVPARPVLPPGLAAGTAYRGTDCGSQIGGANPAWAAGGARSAGSGD
jgi:hypothetical protein